MTFLRRTPAVVCALALVPAALLVNGCKGDVAGSSTSPATDGGEVFDAGSDSGALGDPPPIDPPPGPTDIVGSIHDSYGARSTNATVALDGVVSPLDPWGRFVVRDAPASYSLLVGSPGNAAQLFDGATTRTPDVIVAGGSSTFVPMEAPFHIAFPSPDQPGAQFVTFVYDPGGIMSWQNSVPDMEIEIEPRTTATVTVYVIEYLQSDNSKPPTQFLGFYEEPGVVVDVNQTTNVNPTMTPVTTQKTITTSPTAAAGMTVYEAYLYLRPKTSTQTPTLFNTWALLNSPATWSFDIPQIADLEFFIGYQAWETGQPGSFGGGASEILEPVADDGTSPSPSLPAAPVITSPAAGATFGVGTSIAWATTQTGCTLSMSPQGGDGTHGFRITTTSHTVTVPDLSTVGSSLQSGATYQAYLQCGEPGSSADDPDFPSSGSNGPFSSSNANFTLVAQ